jgi:chaperonin GroES
MLPSGERSPQQVREGDRVVFRSYAGTEVKVDGDELLILREDDILAVLQ